jgi:broad specificity phosphatase PhoE
LGVTVWFCCFPLIFATMGNPSKGGIGMNKSCWHSTQGKTVYLLRHAEAQHNVVPHNFTLPDPSLTSRGVRQAQRLVDNFSADALANVELIVTSPLRRCLQTVSNAFGRRIDWGIVPVVVLPDLQETGDHPCDTGSSPAALEAEFPQLASEIRRDLKPDWYAKVGENASDEEALLERAQRVKQWLGDRPERVIMVVSHNGILRRLLGNEEWCKHGKAANGFQNAEARRYTAVEGASMIAEVPETLQFTFEDELIAVGTID